MDRNRWFVMMTDADEETRAEARDELNLIMDDEVARGFLDIVSSDADEEIVADAIVGLGPIIEEAGIDFDEEMEPELEAFSDPGISRETFDTILREIREVYDDPKRPALVRRRAFEVLVRNPQDWQAAEIRKHFASDDPKWKLTAVFGMGNVRGFAKEIAAVVNSAEGDLLFEAVRAAGSWEVTAAAKRIRDLAAYSDDVDLRIAAIEALPNVDPSSEEILLELTHSDDEEVAEAAREALDLSFRDEDDEDDDEDEEDEE